MRFNYPALPVGRGLFTNQPVRLQFRKAGTTTYTTVKTVHTSSTGDRPRAVLRQAKCSTTRASFGRPRMRRPGR